jgi:glycosyltransferase involved in cell wall biosynthesis
MRDHDAVAVPSRSTYPEGLPLTIYEAFCSRTPLVVSNHPMFTSALGQQQGALMFKEQNPESLADALKALMTEPTLYHKLSIDSEAAWKSIQVPLKIDELVTRWLDGSPENTAALKRYSLEALGRVN